MSLWHARGCSFFRCGSHCHKQTAARDGHSLRSSLLPPLSYRTEERWSAYSRTHISTQHTTRTHVHDTPPHADAQTHTSHATPTAPAHVGNRFARHNAAGACGSTGIIATRTLETSSTRRARAHVLHTTVGNPHAHLPSMSNLHLHLSPTQRHACAPSIVLVTPTPPAHRVASLATERGRRARACMHPVSSYPSTRRAPLGPARITRRGALTCRASRACRRARPSASRRSPGRSCAAWPTRGGP